MSMATELIAAVISAEKNIDDQIAKLTAFAQQNDNIMQEISQALEGSNHPSANNMQQRVAQTKTEIQRIVQMLEASKSKLVHVRQI